MLALGRLSFGVLRFTFLDKSKDAPGGQVGDISSASSAMPRGDASWPAEVDLLTYDVENVPGHGACGYPEGQAFLAAASGAGGGPGPADGEEPVSETQDSHTGIRCRR